MVPITQIQMVCAQLYGFSYSYQIFKKLKFWPRDGTLTSTITPGQSRSGNKGGLHTPQSSRTGASPPNTDFSHTQHNHKYLYS